MKDGRRWGLAPLLVATLLLMASCHDDPAYDDPRYKNPTDSFVGTNTLIPIEQGCEGLDIQEIMLYIKAPDGSIIERGATHNRIGSRSEIELIHGLSEGDYQLLYIAYDGRDEEGNLKRCEFGLGCRISFREGMMQMHSHYNEIFDMFSSGTEVDTLYIASNDKLINLLNKTNDIRYNSAISDNTYFLQLRNLDGEELSKMAHRKEGWLPIGYQQSLPFRGTYDGGGHTISGLWVERELMAPVGFVGVSEGSRIYNLHLKRARLKGNMAVGGLVGIAISSEGRRLSTMIDNCTVSESTIEGAAENSYGVGGLLGIVDYQSRAHVHESRSLGNVIRSMHQAGGVVGAGVRTSSLLAYHCENTSEVTSNFNSAGGIVGMCDSLAAGSCINRGRISGAVDFVDYDEESGLNDVGCGGIAGGVGAGVFAGCRNHGEIIGRTGVGGVVGSARFAGGDPEDGGFIYNNVAIYQCANYASVSGDQLVGGLCGEAQIGVYGGYNEGNITAKEDYAAGIVANGAIAVVHNCVNRGYIYADAYAAGIVGMTASASISLNQNYGDVEARRSHGAGIVAIAGNRATVGYCTNYGDIYHTEATRALTASEYFAGIWGEAGDPNEWTALEIASLVYSSVEIVLGVAGAVCGTLEAKMIGGNFVVNLSSATSMFGALSTFADTLCWAENLRTKIGNEEQRQKDEEAYAKLLEECAAVEGEINQARVEFVPGINSDFAISGMSGWQNTQFAATTNYLSGSSENIQSYDQAINEEQYALMKKYNDQAAAKEFTHQVLSGLFIAVSAVGTMLTIVASGGTLAPVAIAGSVMSGVGAVCGGVNAIWETCTETVENTVHVPQNSNYGYVYVGEESTKVGGIIGVAHENCLIEDCLNAGGGTAGGHIAGSIERGTDLFRCLTIADEDEWGGVIYANKENTVDVADNYYFTRDASVVSSMADGGKGLTLEQMRDPSQFTNWDFNAQNGRWAIPGGDNAFPVPFESIFINR